MVDGNCGVKGLLFMRLFMPDKLSCRKFANFESLVTEFVDFSDMSYLRKTITEMTKSHKNVKSRAGVFKIFTFPAKRLTCHEKQTS